MRIKVVVINQCGQLIKYGWPLSKLAVLFAIKGQYLFKKINRT